MEGDSAVAVLLHSMSEEGRKEEKNWTSRLNPREIGICDLTQMILVR